MDKAVLESLIAEGLSHRKIADRLGVSAGTVRHWLRVHGLRTLYGPRGATVVYRCACGETRPERFYGAKSRTCADCHNAYTTERARAQKQRAVDLLGGACQRCGYHECLAALSFHHLDPTHKDPGFVHWRHWSWERLAGELRGCVLLCLNCHNGLHAGEVTLEVGRSIRPTRTSGDPRRCRTPRVP